jgi:hypothetical protein
LSVPELFTSRYFAEEVLSGGGVVPVRVGYEAPIVPLGYPLQETAEALVPGFAMLGEWDHFCRAYLHKLDALGAHGIGKELSEISDRRGGRPLALLDYEDLVRGTAATAWCSRRGGKSRPAKRCSSLPTTARGCTTLACPGGCGRGSPGRRRTSPGTVPPRRFRGPLGIGRSKISSRDGTGSRPPPRSARGRLDRGVACYEGLGRARVR